MLDNLINLDQLLRDAKNCSFENQAEIDKEFRDIAKLVNHYHRECVEVFHKSNSCEHNFVPKDATFRLSIHRDPIYTFTSKCTKCGKETCIRKDNKAPPEGFEDIHVVDKDYW